MEKQRSPEWCGQGETAVVGIAARGYICFSPGLYNLFLFTECLVNQEDVVVNYGLGGWSEAER